PVADTKYGRVQGKFAPLNNASQYGFAFMGIPYAAPPINDLRFKSPQPVRPWKGIRDATKVGSACPQDVPTLVYALKSMMGIPLPYDIDDSEDCLTLDVYTPSLTGKRPVVVHIHGGGLQSGASSWSSMADLRVNAVKYDQVAVSIQYRLGLLGFMSTEDGSLGGNMGFKDQVLALKWVQDNIANFGGDPSQVTISGESAGAWSVSMHLVSPCSAGLFQRAIMSSGSIVGMPQFSTRRSLEDNAVVATALGCPNTTTDEIVSCLKTLPMRTIAGYSVNGMTIFWPVVDNECFPDTPLNMMKQGNFHTKVDVMAGFTYVEGFMFAHLFFPHVDFGNLNMSVFRQVYSSLRETQLMHLSIQRLRHSFCQPLSAWADRHGQTEYGKQKVYLYEFNGRPFYSSKPDFIRADHTDDLTAVYGFSQMSEVFGFQIPADRLEENRLTEDVFMQYLASFAATGVPSGEGLPHWPELRENGSYMRVDAVPELRHNYQPEQMKFWLETV
ncbi:hypothetical protein CAPTEDRAFT_34043, partial [Capitella teleta]|uniref:Carboxylic ester hydrolase n=1 Tax=Capitella teleta TaxID=283909 RepID=X2B306_CAPTE